MGNLRRRIRSSSITTIHPVSRAEAKVGRLRFRSLSCASGRFGARRKRMTEGFISPRNARMRAKSVSAEIAPVLPVLRGGKSRRPLPIAGRTRERERHRDRPPVVPWRPTGIRHYRRGISRWAAEHGQFALANRFGSVAERLADVFALQVGIRMENLVLRHPFTHHPDNGGNGNPQTSNARKCVHLGGVHGDSCEGSHTGDFNGSRGKLQRNIRLNSVRLLGLRYTARVGQQSRVSARFPTSLRRDDAYASRPHRVHRGARSG